MDERNTRVGFVGLGQQGSPMARRIVAAGWETTVFARRPQPLEPFRGTAAKIASSLRELGAASDVLCVCVLNGDQVRAVVLGAEGDEGALSAMAPGSTVVIHSTVHPDVCHEVARAAGARGVAVLDAAVSGGAPAAEAGTLAVLAGGDEAVFHRCRPVFEAYGNPVALLGPLGSGQMAKLLNNLLFAAQLGLVHDTVVAAKRLGMDTDRVMQVLQKSSSSSFAMGIVGGQGLTPNETLHMLLRKDVDAALAYFAGADVDLRMVETPAEHALAVVRGDA